MVKKYLLDTNICVFCMRGKFEMNRKIRLVGINNCYLSEITVAELYFGAENSDNPKKTMRETEDFISLSIGYSYCSVTGGGEEACLFMRENGEVVDVFWESYIGNGLCIDYIKTNIRNKIKFKFNTVFYLFLPSS